jgi:hypothetical protein
MPKRTLFLSLAALAPLAVACDAWNPAEPAHFASSGVIHRVLSVAMILFHPA